VFAPEIEAQLVQAGGGQVHVRIAEGGHQSAPVEVDDPVRVRRVAIAHTLDLLAGNEEPVGQGCTR
jgi:hypothetical protein